MKGFTLIELIVVVAIILIFSAMAIAQYNGFSEQSKLKSEVKKVADVLELARKKSLSNEILNSCVGNFSGYKLNFSSNKDYELSFCCAGSCSTSVYTYHIPSTSSTITIVPPSPSFVQFYPNGAKTNLISDLQIKLMNTALPAPNQCMQITVSKIGVTTQDDTFVSC